MNRKRTLVIVGLVAVIAVALFAIAGILGVPWRLTNAVNQTVGLIAQRDAVSAGDHGTAAIVAPVPESSAPQDSKAMPSQELIAAEGGAVTAGVTERQMIRSATIDVRVKAVPDAVSGVRSAAAALGGDITSLTYYAGPDQPVPLPEPSPEPLPLDSQKGSTGVYVGPKTASIVIRVPADKLQELTKRVSALGVVTGESANVQDVTQQVIDLEARLRNLRAEEARLRSFFDKATKVSEMLAIEQELARVRGEIESLQAQLTYMEDQVAEATLTVQLYEPSAIVSPEGTGWGFVEAVTAGIRAAASILRSAVTAAIALSPIWLGILLVWLIVHQVRKRRGPSTTTPMPPATSESDPGVESPSPQDDEPTFD